jgi:hypothetical protein
VNIPKPLLVVIVIIIVLGVLSCGAGALRGSQDAGDPTPGPGGGGAFGGQVAPADIELTGDCSFIPGAITVPSNCHLTMHPQAFIPRKLRLVVALAAAVVTVSQVIQNDLRSSEPTTRNPGQDIEVSVAGSSPVVVDVLCFSGCRLDFSP